MISSHKIILSCIFSCLLFSCSKKYPEDGIYYMGKSPEKRIVGRWKISKYYINGADSTAFLFKQYIGHCVYGINQGNICYQYGVMVYDVGKKDPGEGDFPFTFYEGGGGGYFNLVNDDNYITCYYAARSAYNPFREDNPVPNTHSLWKILELTNITFKISNTIHDTTYNIEFAKQ